MEVHTPVRTQSICALFLLRAGSFSFTNLISNKYIVYIILRGAACVGEDLVTILVSNSAFIPGKPLDKCLTL